jgi:hypothetical protein
MYSSILFNLTINGGGKEIRCPLYRRLGEPRASEHAWKILPPLGFNPGSIQPVVRHYTDYIILAHMTFVISN